MAKLLVPLPDLEVEATGHFTWTIDNWRDLQKREHGPIFTVGDNPWYVKII